ncbi:hypothetical protein CsSME_00016371 [Camellia sinensis var. sinensis]
MPRGSLENHLFRSEFFGILNHFFFLYENFCNETSNCCITGGSYFQPLSWNLRLRVAIGAAKGLAFLHSAETKVIYRDFKTSNILLDSVCICGANFCYHAFFQFQKAYLSSRTVLIQLFIIYCQNYNAKLSDFGLAKDGPTGDKSHVSTRVMGTYGYAAPEYLATGMILNTCGFFYYYLKISIYGVSDSCFSFLMTRLAYPLKIFHFLNPKGTLIWTIYQFISEYPPYYSTPSNIFGDLSL